MEFFGAASYHKVELVQGTNVRDHLDGSFNNAIDGITTVAAFNLGPGQVRLDQQIYNLPTAFGTDTLTTIRFTGFTNNPGGTPFIVAATVLAAVPEPGSWALMATGLLGLGWRARRNARAYPSASPVCGGRASTRGACQRTH